MMLMLASNRCFIDTNIWLYAFSDDDVRKKEIAQSLIKTSQPIISSQVLNEICVNLIRQAKFPEPKIHNLIESFYAQYEVVESHRELLILASQLRQQYALSYWDSLIVAAALDAGVKKRYSEDMQDGLIILNTVKIINPFNKNEPPPSP